MRFCTSTPRSKDSLLRTDLLLLLAQTVQNLSLKPASSVVPLLYGLSSLVPSNPKDVVSGIRSVGGGGGGGGVAACADLARASLGSEAIFRDRYKTLFLGER